MNCLAQLDTMACLASTERDRFLDLALTVCMFFTLTFDFSFYYFVQAQQKSERGQHLEAISDYDKAIALRRNFTRAYFGRGMSFAVLGNRRRALDDFTEVIKGDPFLGYRARGRLRFEAGDYRGSIADSTEAIALNPKDALAHSNRAHAYEQFCQYPLALSDYREAARFDPTNPMPHADLGAVLFLLAHRAAAKQELNKAIELDKKCLIAIQLRGLLCVATNDLRGAIRDFTRVCELYPNAQSLKLRAEAKAKMRDKAGALLDHQEAIKFAPDDSAQFVCYGRSLLIFGRYTEAIQQLNRALLLEQGNSIAYHLRGIAWLETGDQKRASEDLKEALKLLENPCFAENFYERGLILAELGEVDAALRDFHKAHLLNPECNARVHVERLMRVKSRH